MAKKQTKKNQARITNSEFAFGGKDLAGNSFGPNASFIQSCEKAGIKPSARQASKYRNNKGIAFKVKKYNPAYLQKQVELNKADNQ